MKARQRLCGAILDPKELRIIGTAFDGAWEIIQPTVPRNPHSVEAARLKLADIMLSMDKDDGPLNIIQLRDRAVWLYRTSRV
jgi:hypothetical protein